MKISFIIPVFNESDRIENSLQIALNYLPNNFENFELIVVDDGSSDNTCDIVKKYNNVKLIELGQNLGKGAAVRAGMLEADGNIRIFSDADFSTPITEIPKVIEHLNNDYDVFIGSRALDHSLVKKHQPFYREFMGKVFNKVVQIFILWGIKDTQCGFKAFKGNVANKIFQHTVFNGFSFDVEVLYLARKFGFKICEVPIIWYNDDRTKVSAINDAIKMFVDIFKIKRYHKALNNSD